MSKIPSMPSKELVRMLEKGGAVFVRQGATDMLSIQESLKARDIQHLSKWGKNH